MSIKYQNINLILDISNRYNVHKKIFIFFLGFILFGTLSFISYSPSNNNIQTESKVVLLDHEAVEKQSNISTNTISNFKAYKNEFALIVGSFNQKFNADNLELEMKQRGFKDCTIISEKKLNKYWVVLKCYENKNQAVLARERYLVDGWIKRL